MAIVSNAGNKILNINLFVEINMQLESIPGLTIVPIWKLRKHSR